MRLEYTATALRALDGVPAPVRKAFYKQASFLLHDIHHPSLRAKKYGGVEGIWQARVNIDWRFYFRIIENRYVIEAIIPHPK
jgi:mRNA-degrading endonuclease RelE of RelBE toxin-antitoxin system